MWLLLASPRVWAVPCVDYDSPEDVVDFDAGVEASGLAGSVLRPGVFFTHGDMEDPDIIISFDASGFLEEHDIHHADNNDWEDIASAPCPDGIGDCLFIGDTGASDHDDESVTIYVVREPALGEEDLYPIATWEADLPEPLDAEALLVHPLTGEITLISKDDDGKVLRMSEDHTWFYEIGETDLNYVTGGAWDRTGQRVVLRNGHEIYVWETDPLAPDAHWEEDPLELDADPVLHGEAVTFAPTGELYSLDAEQPLLDKLHPCIPLVFEDEEDDDEDDEDEDDDRNERSAAPELQMMRDQIPNGFRVSSAGCRSGGGGGPWMGGVVLFGLGLWPRRRVSGGGPRSSRPTPRG